MSRKSKTTKSESRKAAAKKNSKKSKAQQVATPTAVDTTQPVETPATEKKTRKAKTPKPKRVSALDAATQILQAEGAPMACKAMIEAMTSQGLWSSPGGKTPEATLYSAIIREIANKGTQARFRKVERGQFAFNG